MKISQILFIVGVVFSCCLIDGEVSAQGLLPGYYGESPIFYTNGRNDDDYGFLLAILLLASRRGSSGNCGCCNNARTVPVPYPIPFPTNNPIITTRRNRNDDDVDDNSEKPKNDDEPIVNVITKNVDVTSSSAKTNNNVNSNSSSSSSSSGSGSGGSSSNKRVGNYRKKSR